MNSTEKVELVDLIRGSATRWNYYLLVEHDMNLV
jgi:ABC-type branched-subunit amino acid transport system ATPase component